MVFSSLFFLYAFLPLCLIVYQIPRSLKFKNLILLAFSLFFYAWGEPFWIIQMLISGVWVFLAGLASERYKHDPAIHKTVLTIGTVGALLPLFVFKYAGFFIGIINVLPLINIPLPRWTMPIGISFYTFQILSYLIDLYRGQCKVQKFLPDFLLYQTLFPQLIAGPIVRYSDIEQQLQERRTTIRGLADGTKRFIIGLAKKTLIANYAGTLVAQTIGSINLNTLSGIECLVGIIAFTIQIYFDFSGYSDMAIGLGHMFGFDFKENFEYPYFSKSVTEFWRRWHISLGTFFRDYVYIPLGGNRHNRLRNAFIVWILTGFWHGAGWNFIFWGLYYFAILQIEKYLTLKYTDKIPRAIMWIPMSIVTMLGFAIFYFTSIPDLGIFLSRLFTFAGNDFINLKGKLLFNQNLVFFIFSWIASMPIVPEIRKRLPGLRSYRFRATKFYVIGSTVSILLLLLISTASLVGDSFNPFLYFRF
ncbi:MAG: MBOAT family O-acyltransferase [Saccharofermentanales bacterium]|jgi:alginate O-acetyltransferase complex protein AlgI